MDFSAEYQKVKLAFGIGNVLRREKQNQQYTKNFGLIQINFHDMTYISALTQLKFYSNYHLMFIFKLIRSHQRVFPVL